jgi:hypothetical protein
MVLTAALISALLFSAVAGMQTNFLVKANFVFPPSNPGITIESPANRTYETNTLSLKVTVGTYKTGYPGGPASEATRLFTYALDGGEPENIIITNASVARNPGGNVFFEGSMSLPELTEGLHNLTVRVVFVYDNPTSEGYIVRGIHTESEATAYFRVDTVPQNISILMPENSTYMLEVPLKFFIDEPASWIVYTLDGQENVTVTGNMTIPAPSVGQHKLTLYAKDSSGNPTASETITFSVADPLPTVLNIVSSVATVGVLLVYFKKRKQ